MNKGNIDMQMFKPAAVVLALGAALSPSIVAAKTINQLPAVFSEPSAPAVPEPATWATMIIGFALIGIALRARNGVRAKV